MNISKIHHCSFIVQDLDRALHFYCNLLEVPLDPLRPDLGYPGAWLQLGAQQIHLMVLPKPYTESEKHIHGGRDRHVALIVDDIQQVINRFEEEGIAYTRSKSGRSALFCRDPDGNALEFMQQVR